jgi:hypothetical protein
VLFSSLPLWLHWSSSCYFTSEKVEKFKKINSFLKANM